MRFICEYLHAYRFEFVQDGSQSGGQESGGKIAKGALTSRPLFLFSLFSGQPNKPILENYVFK